MNDEYKDDGTSGAIEQADAAYDALRAVGRMTISRPVPAPEAYKLLGNLKNACGYFAAQALGQIARGLVRSQSTHDVYEDDGGDPAERAQAAARWLLEAAEKAREIGELLEDAQSAIAGQGYREGAGSLSQEDPGPRSDDSW